MDDDAALLAAWRAGDSAAGSELFGRHARALFRFLRAKVGDQIAEDLLQETFLACVRAQPQTLERADFRAYLYTAARSRLINHLERERPVDGAVDPALASLADLRTSPSQAIARREHGHILLVALRELPLDLQIAIELFYFEQMGVGDVATVVGVPAGTVKTRLRRGRELLGIALGKLGVRPSSAAIPPEELRGWPDEPPRE